jgi:hypothetical protein
LAVTQMAVLLGQTHRPFRQTVPSGQQILRVVPRTTQTLSLLQQAPLTQMLPGGQQMREPEAVVQGVELSWQTHRPSRQSMPSGQQKVPALFLQALGLGQHLPLMQTDPSGQQTWALAVPQVVVPGGQTHRPSRQTSPAGQQNGPFGPLHACAFGQHRPLMQTVPSGQQMGVAPGMEQVVVPGGQTHRPSRQTIPVGQQNGPVGPVQAWTFGQHSPLMQTVPLGQQTNDPVAVVQAVVPGGQTHRPSWQTVPSGQQNWPLGLVQARRRGQHWPLMQTVPSGQHVTWPVDGFPHTVVPGAQTHWPFLQTMFSGQQNGGAVVETRQRRTRGQHVLPAVWALAAFPVPRPATTIPEISPTT